MKFVVKPPNMTTMSFGRPAQRGAVPAAIEAFSMGVPAGRPKAKHALMMPEKVATMIPLVKLNSLIASCFLASGISRSFVQPARAAMKMPTRQSKIPPSVTNPGSRADDLAHAGTDIEAWDPATWRSVG